jgi:hypothetical protein
MAGMGAGPWVQVRAGRTEGSQDRAIFRFREDGAGDSRRAGTEEPVWAIRQAAAVGGMAQGRRADAQVWTQRRLSAV